jgi:hypothetical protein
VARKTGALVDPHALARVQREARAPVAAVPVQADELSRVTDYLAQLLVVEVADLRPG